jgi:hypothetical protein
MARRSTIITGLPNEFGAISPIEKEVSAFQQEGGELIVIGWQELQVFQVEISISANVAHPQYWNTIWIGLVLADVPYCRESEHWSTVAQHHASGSGGRFAVSGP